MKNSKVDIVLVAEGTYPYVHGGVSTWIHQLISNLKEFSFGIIFLGSRKEDRAIYAKNIRIRSGIRVSDVKLVGNYRDKATKTDYVLISVDARAWIKRITKRLSGHIRLISEHIDTARALLLRKRPIQAYAQLSAVDTIAYDPTSDLAVLLVLQKKSITGKKMRDIIILAFKPQNFPDAMADLAELIRSDQVIISILAGIQLADLTKLLGGKVIRVMPNTACLAGAMAAGMTAGSDVTPQEAQQVRQLLETYLKDTGK
jgi:hypothetical protein